MTANYVDELVWMAKNRGDSISRQLADLVRQQAQEIKSLKKENENLKERDRVNSLLFNQVF
jgi:hypothetical protein